MLVQRNGPNEAEAGSYIFTQHYNLYSGTAVAMPLACTILDTTYSAGMSFSVNLGNPRMAVAKLMEKFYMGVR